MKWEFYSSEKAGHMTKPRTTIDTLNEQVALGNSAFHLMASQVYQDVIQHLESRAVDLLETASDAELQSRAQSLKAILGLKRSVRQLVQNGKLAADKLERKTDE